MATDCYQLIAIKERLPFYTRYCQGGKTSTIRRMKTRLLVKEVATKKGISMTRLSQRSEVAYNTVRRIWREPYTDVTISTLQRLADVLGVNVSELVESVPEE
jgi:DNA-binding Xre family transcriptional regulator